MANPITWQNIMAPSLSEASRPLDGAQRAFGSMFDGLTNVIKEREAGNANAWNIGKTNNTNAILDAAYAAKTPEEFLAAQEALRGMAAGFGTQVDSAAVRSVMDQRLGTLRTQAQQGIQFENMLKDERSQPFMQAFRAAALKGDKEGMASAEQAYQAAGGRDLAGLIGFADQRDNELKLRGQADTRFTQDGQMHTARINDIAADNALQRQRLDLERQAQANQAAYQNANIGMQKERLGLDKVAAGERSEDRLTEQRLKVLGAIGNTNKYNIRSAEGAEELMKAINTGDNDELKNSRRTLAAKLTESGVPLGEALNAINTLDIDWTLNSSAIDKAWKQAVANSTGKEGNIQSKTAQFQQEKLTKELARLDRNTNAPSNAFQKMPVKETDFVVQNLEAAIRQIQASGANTPDAQQRIAKYQKDIQKITGGK